MLQWASSCFDRYYVEFSRIWSRNFSMIAKPIAQNVAAFGIEIQVLYFLLCSFFFSTRYWIPCVRLGICTGNDVIISQYFQLATNLDNTYVEIQSSLSRDFSMIT